MSDHMMPASDKWADFSGKVERLWLCEANVRKDGYLDLNLEINGESKNISQIYVDGLSHEEGVHLCSHQLTWLFRGHNAEIESLRAELATAKEVLRDYRKAVHDISPWLSASLTGGCCQEYAYAVNAVLEMDVDVVGGKHKDAVTRLLGEE